MVYIVTGEIDSGKSSKLVSLYNAGGTGDGFVLLKNYIEGNYAGQNIVRLSTGESQPFSYREGFIPSCWNEKYHFKSYSFSHEGFIFAEEITSELLSSNISPVFIDEAGPLELMEKGFYNLICNLLANNERDVYIAVRSSLADEVIKKFNIHKFIKYFVKVNI